MNKKDLVMLIMAKKTLDYQKDPNPDNWVTISGAKVHLDEGGKIDGGAKGKFNGKSNSGTKKQRKTNTGTNTGAESSKKYESKAREAVEYWLHTHYKTESDKNIYASVESVRSQMESMVKSAERNLNDAKKTGKEDLIKKYQDKFDEAKGTLEALNNYYDGGTVEKESAKEHKLGASKMAESKSDFPLKEKNDDFYKKQAQATMRHSLREHHLENTTANKREIADNVRRDIEYRAEKWKQHYEAAKSDPNCSKQRLEGLKEQSDDAQKELDWFNKLYPKADKAKKPRRKPGDPIDVPMEKRDEIVRGVLKDENRAKSFISWATKVINEYNETYGRNRVNYEVSKVDLEDVVPLGKDKAYVTLHFNVKDKNGKGPQRGAAQTFLLKDMTREERKLYFGK